MNELQAKLARRRNLNGEGGGEVKSNAPEVPSASPSGTPNTTVRKSVTPSAAASSSTAPKTTKSFIPNDKPSSGQTELQLKLARRANLNGEPQVARRMSNADPLPPSEADHKSELTPPTSANSSVQDPAGLMTAARSQSNETTLSEVTNLTEELNQAERHAAEAAAAAFESEKLRALEEERVNAERAAAEAAAAVEAERIQAAAEQEESERRRAAEAEEQQRQAAEAAAAAWAESERLRCLEENLRAAAAEAEAAEQERRRIAEEAAAAEEARIAAAVQQAAEEERARAAALAAEEAERHRQAAEMSAAQERQRLAAAAEQAERERVAAAEAAAAAAAAVEAEEAAAAKKRREKEEAELAAASAAAALAEEERAKAAAAAKKKQEEAAAAAAKEAEEAVKRRKEAEAEAAQQAAAAAAAAEKAAKEQADAELRVFQQLWAAETKAAEEEAYRKERERTTSKDKDAAAGAVTAPGATSSSGSAAPAPGASEKGRAVSPMVNRQNTSGSTTSSSSSSGAAAESGGHTPTSAAQSRRAISTPGPTGSHEKWYPGKYLLGSRARATPIAMNPLTAQSHYKELLSTAGDTPMSPPSTPHKTAALTSGSTSGGIVGGVAVGPGAVGTPLVSDSHSTVSGGYSGVKSPAAAAAAAAAAGGGGAASRKEPEGALDFGLTAAAADGGVTPGSVGSGGGESEHVILNNREIEALLAENSRLTALVKKLQAELDLKQAVIDAYEVTYAADPTTPGGGGPSLAASAAAVAIKAAAAATPSKHSVGPSAGTGTPLVAPLTAPPPAPTAGSAAGLAIAAAAAAGAAAPAPMAKQKSYKRHGFRSNYAGAEGDDDDSSGGLFGEEVGSGAASRQFLQSKRSFEGLIADDDAPAGEGAGAVPAEVDFDALMDTLSPHASGAVHNHSSSSSGGSGGSSSGGKYNPLQLASQADLVRSFVQGPARPSGGISEASMKERLEGHGLFGANHSSATASDGSGHPTATGAVTAAGATTGGKGLFKEDATPAKPKPVEADHEMTYSEFISRFPKCLELVDMARRFLFSVIGPNGDGTPPPNRKKVDYIFYGTQKLDERCRDFFDEMQRKFAAHPEFKHESEERILSARDCFEQYIMTRIAEFAFKSSEAREDDDRLARRMRLLSFLTPEALEIKPELFNETLLAIAADELRKINAFKTPGEKVACVVKSAGVIFRSLNLSRAKQDADKVAAANAAAAASGSNANGDFNSTAAVSSSSSASENTPAGADDFLPLFIWVVMRSHIPKLFSNCEYIQAYLNPARLMGKSGYCLINLRSAIEFVMYIEAESLHIDAKEFDTKLAAAEKELNGGF